MIGGSMEFFMVKTGFCIHYTARFADVIVFDSSYKRGRPLTMRIGLRKVMKNLARRREVKDLLHFQGAFMILWSSYPQIL
ncbi:unnamed protein product [Camellia sinensis]